MISASELSEEQKETIRQWAAEGAGLGEIQKRISEELEITMTYLDARMLISDLEISLQDNNKDEEEESAGDADPEDGASALAEDDVQGEPGGVKVTMNEVTPPGMLAVGDVTFGDGETAQWYFDQMGRIGLKPANPDYQPSEDDVEAFQTELQKIAQRQGL